VREVLAGFLASKPVMEFSHSYLFQSGDTALARGRWTLTSKGDDGGMSTVSGNSVEVLRRGPDGGWRYIIDHPWGAN
jgi:ketosteroid isomerase-like protein